MTPSQAPGIGKTGGVGRPTQRFRRRPLTTSASSMPALLGRIVAALQGPFSISAWPIRIGASVGIRLCDPDEPAGPPIYRGCRSRLVRSEVPDLGPLPLLRSPDRYRAGGGVTRSLFAAIRPTGGCPEIRSGHRRSHPQNSRRFPARDFRRQPDKEIKPPLKRPAPVSRFATLGFPSASPRRRSGQAADNRWSVPTAGEPPARCGPVAGR